MWLVALIKPLQKACAENAPQRQNGSYKAKKQGLNERPKLPKSMYATFLTSPNILLQSSES